MLGHLFIELKQKKTKQNQKKKKKKKFILRHFKI